MRRTHQVGSRRGSDAVEEHADIADVVVTAAGPRRPTREEVGLFVETECARPDPSVVDDPGTAGAWLLDDVDDALGAVRAGPRQPEAGIERAVLLDRHRRDLDHSAAAAETPQLGIGPDVGHPLARRQAREHRVMAVQIDDLIRSRQSGVAGDRTLQRIRDESGVGEVGTDRIRAWSGPGSWNGAWNVAERRIAEIRWPDHRKLAVDELADVDQNVARVEPRAAAGLHIDAHRAVAHRLAAAGPPDRGEVWAGDGEVHVSRRAESCRLQDRRVGADQVVEPEDRATHLDCAGHTPESEWPSAPHVLG